MVGAQIHHDCFTPVRFTEVSLLAVPTQAGQYKFLQLFVEPTIPYFLLYPIYSGIVGKLLLWKITLALEDRMCVFGRRK